MESPRIVSWPRAIGDVPKIQGFAGYKAGMTHVFIVDTRATSTTANQEINVAATVIETPPMKVVAVRLYEKTPYGLKTIGEAWHNKLDPELARLLPIPKDYDTGAAWKKLETKKPDDVRILAHTQPKLVSGIPKKKPELMELRIDGGTIEARLDYAKSILGKEIKISDFTGEGKLVDVIAVTKGKGFQGPVKRWGVKLLAHKNRKHRRMYGTLGPWRPSWVRPTVPQAGQMGYHKRTEFNKRVLKIGDRGDEISPRGGFIRYGNVRNSYLLLQGSVPGPTKRLIRLRDAIRERKLEEPEKIEITYISTASKQGK
jgi:large subunit ribosomal protein L3